MQLPHFQTALTNLGSDNDERANVLGVSEKTLRLWKARAPRILRIIARNPSLADALAKDAQQLQEIATSIENAA